MKKLICAAAMSALCATVFAIESENIVGYQRASVPALWSVFSPVFKGVSTENNVVYLSQVTPVLADGTAIATSAKVFAYVMTDADNGIYGLPYMWYPSLGGWTLDGTSKIGDTDVPLSVGAGFAVYNNVKMKAGVESYSKGSTNVAIAFMVSGEVDLVCQNVIPALWSVTGNNSPVSRYLSDFVPKMADGETALTTDAKVFVYMLDDADNGVYSAPYMWYPSLGGWTLDGTAKIADDAVAIGSGVGFAVFNNVKTKAGVESYSKGSVQAPIVFKTKNPLE